MCQQPPERLFFCHMINYKLIVMFIFFPGKEHCREMHCTSMWRYKIIVVLFVLISAPLQIFGLECNYPPDPESKNTRCQLVDYAPCRDLGFNATRFPNPLLPHSTETQIKQFLSRERNFDSNCSELLEPFICGTAFPICVDGLFRDIGPCRKLCTAVRESCGPEVLQWLGLSNCDVFPFKEGPCIWISGCSMETTGSSENNNNMGADGSDSTSLGPRGRTNCTGHLTPLSDNIPSTRDASFAGIKQCTEPCQGVYFDKKQQNLILIWVTSWSLVTLFVSAVMFLTYILNFKKIPSLEAPIYYIALCYAISALCYTLSVAIGGNSLICDSEFTNQFNETATVVDGLRIPLCVSVFGLLYYCTLCTWCWWAILSIEWLLCCWRRVPVNNWWKLCFHIAAWGLPLPFMIAAIAQKHVSGDPILQTCWITKQQEIPYLIVPLLTCLVVCSIIIIVCFARVVNLQKYSLRQTDSNSHDTVEHQILVRVGVYLTVYMLPMGVLLCTYFYEYWFRQQWEFDYLQCSVLGSTNCLNRTVPILPLFLAKVTASLVMGILSLIWAIKRTSADAWKKVCCFCFSSQADNTSTTTRGKYTAPPSSASLISQQQQQCYPHNYNSSSSQSSHIIVQNGHCHGGRSSGVGSSIHKPSFSSESPV